MLIFKDWHWQIKCFIHICVYTYTISINVNFVSSLCYRRVHQKLRSGSTPRNVKRAKQTNGFIETTNQIVTVNSNNSSNKFLFLLSLPHNLNSVTIVVVFSVCMQAFALIECALTCACRCSYECSCACFFCDSHTRSLLISVCFSRLTPGSDDERRAKPTYKQGQPGSIERLDRDVALPQMLGENE